LRKLVVALANLVQVASSNQLAECVAGNICGMWLQTQLYMNRCC